MSREFHIFASHLDTRFTLKGISGIPPQEFSTLFAALRHARKASGGDDGFVVVYGEDGQWVNRIPFRLA